MTARDSVPAAHLAQFLQDKKSDASGAYFVQPIRLPGYDAQQSVCSMIAGLVRLDACGFRRGRPSARPDDCEGFILNGTGTKLELADLDPNRSILGVEIITRPRISKYAEDLLPRHHYCPIVVWTQCPGFAVPACGRHAPPSDVRRPETEELERMDWLTPRERGRQLLRLAAGVRYVSPMNQEEPEHAAAAKEARLTEWLRAQDAIAIGYSGGVDSAYLATVAVAALGAEQVLAIIGRSASYPDSQWLTARAVAGEIGLTIVEVDTDELNDPRYAANPSNRCYFCKTELWSRVVPLARERGIAVVADGTNADDLDGHRPGAQAARNTAWCRRSPCSISLKTRSA